MGVEPDMEPDDDHVDPDDGATADPDAEMPPDERLGVTLRLLLGSDGDLRPRAAERLDRRLQGSSVTSMLSSLGGVGWDTLRLLLTNAPEGADREDGHD